jgi:hypothetical protein
MPPNLRPFKRPPGKIGEDNIQERIEKKGSFFGRITDAIADGVESMAEKRQLDNYNKLVAIEEKIEKIKAQREVERRIYKIQMIGLAVAILGLVISAVFSLTLIFLVSRENSGYALPESVLVALIVNIIAQIGIAFIIVYKWLFPIKKTEKNNKSDNSS